MQTHCICSAAGRATGSKRSITTKPVLCCCISGWTQAVSNGRATLPRPAASPDRSTAGSWRDCQSTSQGRSGHLPSGIFKPGFVKNREIKINFQALFSRVHLGYPQLPAACKTVMKISCKPCHGYVDNPSAKCRKQAVFAAFAAIFAPSKCPYAESPGICPAGVFLL